MQRILEPGEIASLDASAMPRIRLPERPSVFLSRAQRLRALAEGNAISGYLRLMAAVVDAQHAMLIASPAPTIDDASLQLALTHGMPVIPAVGTSLDPTWRDTLRDLTIRIRDSIRADRLLTDSVPAVIAQLDRLDALPKAELDSLATALLEQDLDNVDVALAPFVYAALQVMWTRSACALNLTQIPYLDAPGLCPVCGSSPVASIIRIGGVHEGYRYLQCSLCATEFHFVRVKCANCDSTKGIAYQSLDSLENANEVGNTKEADQKGPNANPAGAANAKRGFQGDGRTTSSAPQSIRPTRAESCDECHTYLKIFAQEKLFDAEPFADDLASLPLDLMMNEAGYSRAHPHPFLWPATTPESDA